MKIEVGEYMTHYKEAVTVLAIVDTTVFLEVVLGENIGKIYLSHIYMLESDLMLGHLW